MNCRNTSQEAHRNHSQHRRVETLENATSSKPSWWKGMSVYAPRCGHVRAFSVVSRIHIRRQMRVKAMGRHNLNCQLLGTQIMPASSVSKVFPVASKDRSERAQCQAKKTGKIEKTIAMATVCTRKRENKQCSPPHRVEAKGKGAYAWQNDVKASVYKAWQITPICRLLVERGLRA